jgi:hypothetical protein
MSYSGASRIKVRLYRGKVVEAEITAITNQSAGRKVHIIYGSATASINPSRLPKFFHPSRVKQIQSAPRC